MPDMSFSTPIRTGFGCARAGTASPATAARPPSASARRPMPIAPVTRAAGWLLSMIVMSNPSVSSDDDALPDGGAVVDLGPLTGMLGYALRRAQIAVFQDFHRRFA